MYSICCMYMVYSVDNRPCYYEINAGNVLYLLDELAVFFSEL